MNPNSRYAPEVNAYGLAVLDLAMKAARLRARAEDATGPRAELLHAMEAAYMCWGLAKQHAEMGSDTAGELLEEANLHLSQARSLRGGV